MRYEKGKTVGGIPILKIRDLLRRDSYFNLHNLAYDLKISDAEAKRVLSALISEGYLEPSKDAEGQYEKTDLGQRLTTVSGTPRMSMARAEELIKQVVLRAYEIKNDPEFTQEVKYMVLFGSVLEPAAKDFGDVDIAIDLDRKEGVTQEDEQRQTQRDANSGKSIGGIFGWIMWPREKVYRYLKNRRPGISFVDLREHAEMLNKVPTMLIYPLEGKKKSQ